MRFLVLLVTIFFVFATPIHSSAQPWRRGMYDKYERAPYGQFCPGMRGDPYGARRQIRTVNEARHALEQYFKGIGKEVGIGKLEERRWFFIAELLDSDGFLIDKAIIDKRTGRIRSIY